MTIALHIHIYEDKNKSKNKKIQCPMSIKYNAEWMNTIGDWNQRSNHTMSKMHLLMNEFLKRVVCIWGRVKLCALGLSCMV